MTARERVLEAHPWAGMFQASIRPPDEIVQEAFDEVAGRGILDADDIRVVAYARYAGVGDDEPTLLIRGYGSASALRVELERHQLALESDPSQFVRAVQNSSTSDLVRSIKDPSAGWIFVVHEIALEADYDAVVNAVPFTEDATRLISAEFVRYLVGPSLRAPLASRLLQSDHPVDVACGRALVFEWVQEAVLARNSIAEALQILEDLPKPAALATLGALIDDFFRWAGYAQLRPEQRKASMNAEIGIQAAGRAVAGSPEDVDRVLEAAGDRRIHAIAALAEWMPSDDARRAIGERLHDRAMEVFEIEFSSLMEVSSEAATEAAARPEWLVLPLSIALVGGGLDPVKFTSTYDRLASDAFSKGTRYGTWLRDRRRALALIAIGAIVARHRGDKTLLSAVLEAAEHAKSQPQLDQTVFDEKWIRDVCGVDLPTS